jgi:hypothetical protein
MVATNKLADRNHGLDSTNLPSHTKSWIPSPTMRGKCRAVTFGYGPGELATSESSRFMIQNIRAAVGLQLNPECTITGSAASNTACVYGTV